MNVYVLQNQARSLNDYLIIILKKLDVFLLSFWSLNAHFFLIFWGFQVRGKSDVILKSPKWIMHSNTFALSHKRSWIVTSSSQFFSFTGCKSHLNGTSWHFFNHLILCDDVENHQLVARSSHAQDNICPT